MKDREFLETNLDLPNKLKNFDEWEEDHLDLTEEQWEETLRNAPEPEEIPPEEQERLDKTDEALHRCEMALTRAFKKQYGVDYKTYKLRRIAELNKHFRQAMGMDRFMTVEQVADELCISPKTVRNQLSLKSFPIKHIKRAGRVLFFWSDVLDFIMGIQDE